MRDRIAGSRHPLSGAGGRARRRLAGGSTSTTAAKYRRARRAGGVHDRARAMDAQRVARDMVRSGATPVTASWNRLLHSNLFHADRSCSRMIPFLEILLALPFSLVVLAIAVPRFDTLRQLPPPARLVVDVPSLLAALAIAAVAVVVLAAVATAGVVRARPMKVMRSGA